MAGPAGPIPRAYLGAHHPKRPAGIGFRRVEARDQGFLEALYASTRENELAPVPWPEEAKRDFLAQQFQLQDRHYRQAYVGADLLLIERDARPIGRVYVHRGRREIRLMDIALIPAERGHGIGTALMLELMDEARDAALDITLHVEPDNPAKRLYERLGFRTLENRGVYDFMGWSPDAEGRGSKRARASRGAG